MANQFMKKCTHCGTVGAPFTVTDNTNNTIQLCHGCMQKHKEAQDKNSSN